MLFATLADHSWVWYCLVDVLGFCLKLAASVFTQPMQCTICTCLLAVREGPGHGHEKHSVLFSSVQLSKSLHVVRVPFTLSHV